MQRWLDALLKAGFIYKVTLTDETNQQQRYLFIKKSHAIDFAISNGLTENDVVSGPMTRRCHTVHIMPS